MKKNYNTHHMPPILNFLLPWKNYSNSCSHNLNSNSNLITSKKKVKFASHFNINKSMHYVSEMYISLYLD